MRKSEKKIFRDDSSESRRRRRRISSPINFTCVIETCLGDKLKFVNPFSEARGHIGLITKFGCEGDVCDGDVGHKKFTLF